MNGEIYAREQQAGVPTTLRQRRRCGLDEKHQIGYFYDATFRRVFKDGDQWGDSTSFDDRDLPNLAKAATDVHTWIYRQKANAVTVNGSDAP